MKLKFLATSLAATMIMSMVSITALASSTFSDMPNDYSTSALQAAVNNGLLGGYNGKIMPDENLTRAQMGAILVRAFGAESKANINNFTDVVSSQWYYEDLAAAVHMGLLKGDGKSMRPDAPITRQEAFVVLARAFNLEANNTQGIDSYKDAGSVASWAKESMAAMIEAGFVKGDGVHLNPNDNITRKDFAVTIDRMVETYVSESGTVQQLADGSVMVKTGGVTVKSVTVDGDLILGDGVGNDNVTLDGTKVNGTTLIRGGDVITVKNKALLGDVVITKVDGDVTLKMSSDSKADKITIKANDVVLSDLPAGIVVTVADGYSSAKVNGKTVKAGTSITTEATKPSGGGGGGSSVVSKEVKTDVEFVSAFADPNVDIIVLGDNIGAVTATRTGTNGITIKGEKNFTGAVSLTAPDATSITMNECTFDGALTIDAPKADVNNNSVVEGRVTIVAVSDSSYTPTKVHKGGITIQSGTLDLGAYSDAVLKYETTDTLGNTVVTEHAVIVSPTAGKTVTVEATSEVRGVQVGTATGKVVVNAPVKTLDVNAAATVDVHNDVTTLNVDAANAQVSLRAGTVTAVDVKATATITVDGATAEKISVQSGAENTHIEALAGTITAIESNATTTLAKVDGATIPTAENLTGTSAIKPDSVVTSYKVMLSAPGSDIDNTYVLFDQAADDPSKMVVNGLPTGEGIMLGYFLTKWNKDGIKIENGTKIAVPTTGETITLTADFIIRSYNIYYKESDGAVTTMPEGCQTTYTITQTFTLPIPTKPNHFFVGWFTDKELTHPVTEIVAGSTGDKTFFAKWTQKKAIADFVKVPAGMTATTELDMATKTYNVTLGGEVDSGFAEIAGVATVDDFKTAFCSGGANPNLETFEANMDASYTAVVFDRSKMTDCFASGDTDTMWERKQNAKYLKVYTDDLNISDYCDREGNFEKIFSDLSSAGVLDVTDFATIIMQRDTDQTFTFTSGENTVTIKFNINGLTLKQQPITVTNVSELTDALNSNVVDTIHVVADIALIDAATLKAGVTLTNNGTIT